MPVLRVLALVALFVGVEAASSSSSSCSGDELQHVKTQIAAIRASLESDAASSSKATSVVPSTCKAALTFDLSTASEEDGEPCASNCINWIEDIVDAPTCGDEEMLTYQRRMAAYLAQCNEHKQVRLQETDTDSFEHSKRLRGLAAGQPEGRALGVKGLMDALLVVTLNNAL